MASPVLEHHVVGGDERGMAVGEHRGTTHAGTRELVLELVGLAVGERFGERGDARVVAVGELPPERSFERGALLVVGCGEEDPAVARFVQAVQHVETVLLGIGHGDGRLALIGHRVVGVGVDVAADHRRRQELPDARAPLVEQPEHQRAARRLRGVRIAVDRAAQRAARSRSATRPR